MSKIKDFFTDVKLNWNEEKTARTLRIVSFFVGLCFNVIGIICIAIWKYVFCNNSEKTKHCIKIAILGWITGGIVCIKLFLHDPYYFMEKQIKKIYKKSPTKIEKVYTDAYFDNEIEQMNRNFEKQRRVFNRFFDAMIEENTKQIQEEQRIMMNEVKNKNVVEEQVIEDESKQNKTIKKVIDHKNGYETTVIEEKSPNSSYKIVTTEYVGDRNKAKGEYKKQPQEFKNKDFKNKKSNDKMKNKLNNKKNKDKKNK